MSIDLATGMTDNRGNAHACISPGAKQFSMKIAMLSNSGNPEFEGQHQSNLEAAFGGRTMACFLVLSLVMSKVSKMKRAFLHDRALGYLFLVSVDDGFFAISVFSFSS